MKKALLLLFSSAALTLSSQATVVYLADSVTVTGGAVNQSFAPTKSGDYVGNTIISGTTTLNDALTYGNKAQNVSGNTHANGRFNYSNFGTVAYGLSSPQDLGGLLFWNYHETGVNDRGTTGATISITYDGGLTDSFDVSFALTPNDADMTSAERIEFTKNYNNVTEVKFSNLQGQNTTFRGWNSVAFVAVPEPSSAALLGLGGLALIMRRRK